MFAGVVFVDQSLFIGIMLVDKSLSLSVGVLLYDGCKLHFPVCRLKGTYPVCRL